MKTNYRKYASKMFTVVFILMLTASISMAQVSTKSVSQVKVVKKSFPVVTIAPSGGAIFPLTRDFRNEFKPGALIGLDVGVRINREVALSGRFSYMFMGSKKTGAPIGQYMEFTAGPRYYFTHPKLKSQIYFEGGAGAYYFKQNSYVDPEDENADEVSQVKSTNAGINGGIGASLFLSDAVDILAKAKYHNIFTNTGSVGFMTISGGIEFKIR
jgi:hypothetical protein